MTDRHIKQKKEFVYPLMYGIHVKKLLFIFLFSALVSAPVAPAFAAHTYDTPSRMHTTAPSSMTDSDMADSHGCCEESESCINHNCHSGGRCNTHIAAQEAPFTSHWYANLRLGGIDNLQTAYTTLIATIAPPPKPYKD